MKNFLLSLAVTVLLSSRALALPDAFDGGTAPLSVDDIPVAPAVAGMAAVKDDRLWVTVKAGGRAVRQAMAEMGISVEEIWGGQTSGVATPRGVAILKERGYSFKAVPLWERFRVEDFPSADSAFHNYYELVSELSSLAESGKGLVSTFAIGKSLQGRDILAVRLNTTASETEKSDKPGIVFMGTHHAREHLSTEVPLLLAKHLVENRDKPEIAELLATRDIYIIPMVNPDGAQYDIDDQAPPEKSRYHMHRKNMRRNSDGSLGVDLNRNYGFHWGEGGASADPRSDIYRGPAPFSEPETSAVKNFVEARPNLKVLLSYHTFSELILYPWGHTDDPLPEAKPLAAYKAMAQAMAQMTGYTPQQSSELYIASGDTTDWAWGTHRIFSFTFELTPKSMWSGGFYPGAQAIATTFQANIRPALYLIKLADDPQRAAEEPTAQTLAGFDSVSGGK